MVNLINFFRSVYFNFRFLSFKDAVHLPIKIQNKVKIDKLKRKQIEIVSPKYKQIILGGGKSPGMHASFVVLSLDKGSSLVFKGKAIISEGCVLRCNTNSNIEFGEDFYCNCNCYFRSASKISIGNDCIFGWNVIINTTDGHFLYHDNILKRNEGPVFIGNHVWVTSECIINKNVKIGNNNVVAQRSVLNKSYESENCLIAGTPAKVVVNNIKWVR